MIYVLTGLAILVVTSLLFWRFLPRNGQSHRLAKTVWAPYLSIGFEGSYAFGVALTISGVAELLA